MRTIKCRLICDNQQQICSDLVKFPKINDMNVNRDRFQYLMSIEDI
jgi:hypothetical protein